MAENKRFCCDNLCNQGRSCPLNQPAEACTEVGQDDTEESHALYDRLRVLIVLIGAAVAAGTIALFWRDT